MFILRELMMAFPTVRDNPDPGSQIDIPDPGFPIFLLIKYKGKHIPLYSETRAFFEPPAHIKNSTNVFNRKLRNFYPEDQKKSPEQYLVIPLQSRSIFIKIAL